jgi:hypothetical protein
MTEMKFAVRSTATAEVRDKDGNLIETVQGETTVEMTEAELREAGLGDTEIEQLKTQGGWSA